MNGEINTTINTLPPFKHFIHSIGQLPSSYLESMSYYETLVWLCNYLKETIIPTVNNTGNAVTELQNLYIELQNYVNNYFDNLDVQEEINNKLDDMAEDGSLTLLIKNYVDPIFAEQQELITNRLNAQDVKINALENGSPLIASDISQMTDTSKIYILTSDGNWYYYNGSTWVSGGIYQSMVIPNNSIDGSNIKDNSIQPYKLFDAEQHEQYEIFKYSTIYPKRLVNGVQSDGNDFYCTDIMEIQPSTTIRIIPNGIDIVDIVEYDNTKQFIRNIRVTARADRTLADDVYFIALSYRVSDASNNSIYALNLGLNPTDNFYNIPFILNKDINYSLNSISPFKLKDTNEQPLKTVLKFVEWYPYFERSNALEPSNDYVVSSLARVKPDTVIYPERTLTTNETLLTYYQDKTFRRSGKITTDGYTIPEDCYYVALIIDKDDADPNFLTCNTLTDKITIDWIDTSNNTESSDGIAFGDSLWANSNGNFNYTTTPYNQSTDECIGYDDHLALVNINVDNRGVGGQTIVQAMNTINNVNEADVEDKDFIILSYGRNDFRTGVLLGTLQNTETTFDESSYIGCLQKSIEHLQGLNPNLKIIIWTPTQSNANGYGIYNTNSRGKKLIDYVNACKEVAQLYSCHVVDMYSQCGINMINLQEFTFEGVHLTNEGYTFTAPYYVNEMKKTLFT